MAIRRTSKPKPPPGVIPAPDRMRIPNATPYPKNPPWKEDSLANASSGARQEDVRTRPGIPDAPGKPNPPINVMPDSDP